MVHDARLDPRITHIEIKDEGLEIIFKGQPTSPGHYELKRLLLPGLTENWTKKNAR